MSAPGLNYEPHARTELESNSERVLKHCWAAKKPVPAPNRSSWRPGLLKNCEIFQATLGLSCGSNVSDKTQSNFEWA